MIPDGKPETENWAMAMEEKIQLLSLGAMLTINTLHTTSDINFQLQVRT